MYDYLIVGAGLFGAVFAAEAHKAGKSCLVIDKRSHIAGNIYTEKVEGIDVHRYGAHIFHTSNPALWQYVNRIVPFVPFVNSPLANYRGELYNLPFNMNTFHQLWGVVTPREAAEELARQRAAYRHITTPKNLEEQALTLCGKDIYLKLIKGYTEKQWGCAATELPAFIIRRIPFRMRYDNNYFNDRYQGIPETGYTRLVEILLRHATVQLHTDFFSERAALMEHARHVLFTGPLDAYFDYCFGRLTYRSLRFEEELLTHTDNYQGNAVVNYTDADVPYTRIIEHKHFLTGQQPHTVITREYPLPEKDDNEPYYPVNNTENQKIAARYKEMSHTDPRLILGGRLGTYSYADMDDTIEAALTLSSQCFHEP